jgi:hypothetical protein
MNAGLEYLRNYEAHLRHKLDALQREIMERQAKYDAINTIRIELSNEIDKQAAHNEKKAEGMVIKKDGAILSELLTGKP